MKFFHVDTQAQHRAAWSAFRVGEEFTIGELPNPLYTNWMNSATRSGHGITKADVDKSAAVMLRELAFESVRGKHFSYLPSRTTCIWACDSEDLARYWLDRVPHIGKKRILEIELLNGSHHKAYEEHLTNKLENIVELERRAQKYWSGQGSGKYEILLQGSIRVVREVHT